MEENDFGLNVEPRADIEARVAAGEAALYIVLRCSEMPIDWYPPGMQGHQRIIGCTVCKEPCWYDPRTYIRGTIALCLPCLRKTPGNEQMTRRVTQEAVDEVRRHQRGAQ